MSTKMKNRIFILVLMIILFIFLVHNLILNSEKDIVLTPENKFKIIEFYVKEPILDDFNIKIYARLVPWNENADYINTLEVKLNQKYPKKADFGLPNKISEMLESENEILKNYAKNVIWYSREDMNGSLGLSGFREIYFYPKDVKMGWNELILVSGDNGLEPGGGDALIIKNIIIESLKNGSVGIEIYSKSYSELYNYIIFIFFIIAFIFLLRKEIEKKISFKYLVIIAMILPLIFINLDSIPFWIDESIMVIPASNILEKGVPTTDNMDLNFLPWQIKNNMWDPATPLYRYSLSVFLGIFGVSEFSARLFSAVSGILLLIVIFIFTKKLFNENISYITIIFLAFSFPFISYCREARYFTFLMLLITISVYSLYKIVKENSKKDKILFPIFVLLTILTHYLGFILLLIFILYVILCKKVTIFKDKNFIKSLLFSIALYIPILILFGASLPFFNVFSCENRISDCHPSPLYYPGIIYSAVSSIFDNINIISFMNEEFIIFSLIPIFTFLGLIVLFKKYIFKRDKNNLILILWFLIPLLILSLQEVKITRYLLMYLLPPIFILTSMGIVKFVTWISSKHYYNYKEYFMILMVLFLLLSPQLTVNFKTLEIEKIKFSQFNFIRDTIFYPPQDNFEYIKTQAEYVKENVKEKDIIVSTFDDAGLSFYTKRKVYSFLNSTRSDKFFMDLLEERGDLWIFDSLNSLDYCLSPRGDRHVDCKEKYNNFYNYYRSNCKKIIIDENNFIYRCS